MGTPTEPRATREPARPPRVVVVIALEERLRVVVDAVTSGEQDRLTDWIRNHPRLADLIAEAAALEREAA